MARFRVQFFKEVMGDTGHSVVALQGTFDVDTTDAGAAVELAKRRFCSERMIREWLTNADRYRVEPIEEDRELARPHQFNAEVGAGGDLARARRSAQRDAIPVFRTPSD